VRHLPAVDACCFTHDAFGLVAACAGGAMLRLHLPAALHRDARFVLLGGPRAGPGLDEPASGYERVARLQARPDVAARALAGTAGAAVAHVWADKPLLLPDLSEQQAADAAAKARAQVAAAREARARAQAEAAAL